MPRRRAAEEETPATRERGWRRFIPALLLFLLVPAIPYLAVAAPVQETIALLAPLMAVSTLLGWWAGGRLLLALLWLALAIWMYVRPVSPTVAYDAIVRAWGLMLAASFGAVSMASPRLRFFPRAIITIAVAFAMVGAILVTKPGAMTRFGGAISDELTGRSQRVLAKWTELRNTDLWKSVAGNDSLSITVGERYTALWTNAPRFTVPVAPALLALESLAALALAWGLYHRASRTRLGPPLGILRDFRFNDQFVWGLVVGVTLLTLPSLSGLRGLGLNLLVFFGTLYLLRGMGVLSWFLMSRYIALAFLIFLALVFWPFATWPIMAILSLAVVLGLGDTWFDLRGRARTTS